MNIFKKKPAEQTHDLPKSVDQNQWSNNLANSKDIKTFIPKKYSETLIICDAFRKSQQIILDVRLLESDEKKRVIDFISGFMYALQGHVKVIKKGVFHYLVDKPAT